MDKNIYPAGWNNKRVRKVIDDIETRTEEEIIAEDEAAFGQDTRSFMFPFRPFDPSTFRQAQGTAGSGTASLETTGRGKTAN